MTSPASHTPAYAAVDLDTCAQEPIHVPGAIQPHGVLLALSRADGHVVVASENTRDALGVEAVEAVGRGLDALVGAELAGLVHMQIDEWRVEEPIQAQLPELPGRFASHEVEVTLREAGERVLVEIEPVSRPRTANLTYQSARAAIARLSAPGSLERLAAQLAMEVREVLAYDRVMVYRFDDEWNGEVIAEERRPDLDPFLGLHYPATDIPAQARQLYTLNWTRLIADLDYAPVRLHPLVDPDTKQPLDLTYSTLRSVSPIHVEYLQNMGVTGSMSISLIREGQLWGLVACHHYSGPHRPAQDSRSAAEFLGQVASAQIVDLERAQAREAALDAQSVLARLTARIATSDEAPIDTMIGDPDLLRLMDATGAAIQYNGRLAVAGRTPPTEGLEMIVAALLGQPFGEVHAHSHLSALDPSLAPFAETAAGALGIGYDLDNWILWLRPEQPQMVDWGGDPHGKVVDHDEGHGVRLSPRKSFEAWRELVTGHSLPWETWQAEVAIDLRTFVNATLLQRSRDQVAVAESLQATTLPTAAPSVPGVQMAVRYVSASTFELGGDWWDALELPDGRLAVVVGDLSGHGVSAVSGMIQVSSAVRAHLFAGESAARSLDLADEMMVQKLPDHVATAAIAMVAADRRSVEITSAGHPPPLLCADGGTRVLETPIRPLLGLGVGGSQSTSVSLESGSTLVLYTDGLVERRDEDMDRSIADLARDRPCPDADRLETWVDDLVAAAHGAGDDDTTVVALRVEWD